MTKQFTQDLINKTIDKLLKQDISIMFTRQATYLYLMKIDNYEKKELYNKIKERAKIHHLNFNTGVLSKELSVANLCREYWLKYFNHIIIDDKNTDKIIKDIAKIMINNNLTYNKLQNLIINNTGDKKTSKNISYQDVMQFLEVATQGELKKLQTFINSRLVDDKKDKIKKVA